MKFLIKEKQLALVIFFLVVTFFCHHSYSSPSVKLIEGKNKPYLGIFLKLKQEYRNESHKQNKVFCYKYKLNNHKKITKECTMSKGFYYCNNKEKFIGGSEEKGLRTKYLEKKELLNYEIVNKENLKKAKVDQSFFYRTKKKRVDSNESRMLVWNTDLKIYYGLKKNSGFRRSFNGSCIRDVEKEERLHHSSYNSGEPVLFAGNAIIREGRILSIDYSSGHYKTKVYNLCNFLTFLKLKGVDITSITVAFHSGHDQFIKYKKECSASDDFSKFLYPKSINSQELKSMAAKDFFEVLQMNEQKNDL